MQELIGTGVALITPFKADGSVDYPALDRLVDFQVDNGVDYLVIMGTTGENVTLTDEEKKSVIQAIKKRNDNRLPMVIGIASNDTRVVVEQIKNTDLSDYVAILSVSPAYNKPSQEGIYQHFKAIAEATDKPIIVYNVPSRTGTYVTVNTIVRLAHDFENIVGIKEADGDMIVAMKMVQYTPPGFLVISGDDAIALPMTLAGGAGVISVIGQAIAQDFSDMIRYALNGDVAEAYELHYKISPSIDMIFEQGNPPGVKALLHQMGICEPHVRLPLVAADEDLNERMKAFLESY
ncbi:4-hydroxy-tetrahydrodipicolinate synthase [Nonlabens sp. Hel1_33_55]|uniref:4-hydroxy-tetrahydrodipicolinate synthase n=1 Tax=Nonlabens sp. Hel1_33_55 TaxID=1336802 RepID=UPI000875B8D9|nr:4-hydroxy-tetrahydrodipicolinate synthase [Nonlabens sp. Hel1_33_55]SCY13531.1 4-hydroxy-tetrahydrodipicolinate synthase [Nonlabens sp. Hel1_33_55]